MSLDLPQYLTRCRAAVDAALDRYLPPADTYPPIIHEAIRYSVFAGGKRLRSTLTIASAEASGGSMEAVMPTACAFEMVHTYSLIHDDLPSMDDDDFRRGKPSSHRMFGEAVAVLAGDALFTLACEVMARNVSEAGAPARLFPGLLRELAEAAGTMGMIGGQVVDVQSEGKPVDADLLHYIHTHKTGALFRAAVRAGAILMEAPAEDLEALTRYGEKFGLAFQIVDDILDREGSTETLGKTAGSDLRKKKMTYPDCFGLGGSKRIAAGLIEEAKAALVPMGERGQILSTLADFVLNRRS